MSETLAVVTRAQLLHRIKAEYMEMPGLRLTAAQAGRLWGLDLAACLDLLERLIAERFLQQRPDGDLCTGDRWHARRVASSHGQGRLTAKE